MCVSHSSAERKNDSQRIIQLFFSIIANRDSAGLEIKKTSSTFKMELVFAYANNGMIPADVTLIPYAVPQQDPCGLPYGKG